MNRVFDVVAGATGRDLLGVLADRLADPLDDPFAAEQVVVHSRGIERWLSQQLSTSLGSTSRGDGVAANIEFPLPSDVVRDVMGAAGVDRRAIAAWQPGAVLWRLLALLDGDTSQELSPVVARVRAAGDRRLVPIQAIADLFLSYNDHRPDMVLDWLNGDDHDGSGLTLPVGDRWQPELMRRLATDIGLPTPAESVVATVAALDAGSPLPADLRRLTLFGFTALPAAGLSVLTALSRRIDVALLMLNPSTARATPLAGHIGEVLPSGLPKMPGRPAPPATLGRASRLLHGWGRDVAELQSLVGTIAPAAPVRRVGASPEVLEPTILQRLQRAVDIDRDAAPGADEIAPDETVQLHACPGPARQVQVLRDEILRLMDADPTLRPRDIIVMCPDVERFAPLVLAHLAGGGDDSRPNLRVRLADRSIRQTNPMLHTMDRLLSMAATRVTVGALTDLFAAEAVRRRFGFSDRDLETIAGWLDGANVRWGMDADARGRMRMPDLRANTMDEGLDRLLLGVAMAREDHRSVGGITPLDDVEGSGVALAGRLAELAERLRLSMDRLRQPHTPGEWVHHLANVVDSLMLASWDDPWQRSEVTGVLADLVAPDLPATVNISLSEVRDLLDDRLQGKPSRANHMTGDLTVCTLVPMRTVPHRVVCLLGMDDAVFPRQPRPHVDDLIARAPRIGDHDPRTEDRQLLLDALMATSDAFVVTFDGSDSRTGEELAPCVPIAELARVINALDDTGILARRITTTHPLFAHDPSAFRPDRASYDALAHRAASATGTAVPAEPAPLPAETVPDRVTVADLITFATSPAVYFARHVLDVWLPDDPEQPDENMPLDLAGLDGWRVADALLKAEAIGEGPARDRVVAAMRGTGLMPPKPLNEASLAKVVGTVDDIAEVCAKGALPLAGGAGKRSVSLDSAGRRIDGVIDGIDGERLIEVSYSTVGPKRIMRMWVKLLVLTVADPSLAWSGVLAGRVLRGWKKEAGAVRIEPIASTAERRRTVATDLLGDLVELWADGCVQPLIAPCDSAHAYARARIVDGNDVIDADRAAAECWNPSNGGWNREAHVPAHQLLLGGAQPYDSLTDVAPRPADTRPMRDPEPHQLGALAVRLWGPVLQRLDGG